MKDKFLKSSFFLLKQITGNSKILGETFNVAGNKHNEYVL